MDKPNNEAACDKSYEAYKREWQKSEDEPPDRLVWDAAWNAALRFAKSSKN